MLLLTRQVVAWTMILAVCWPVAGTAQTTGYPCGPVVEPESVGFDSKGLSRIDSTVQEWIDRSRLVGCSAMILKDGQVAWYRSWGQQDREKGIDTDRKTIYRIYSMTKPVTSVAVMQLVEHGRIGLDDPVSRYLPELDHLQVTGDVPLRRAITVRDLLTHTSGLTYGFFGDTPVDREYRRLGVLMMDRDLGHLVDKLGNIPLLYQPGTRFHYSASTDVLGRLVEVVSETSLADYFEQAIFRPLGMVDSSFMVAPDQRDRFAQMYAPDPESGQLVPAPQWESFRFHNQANRFYSGGAGLCSTIDDYGRFAMMLAGGGQLDGVRLLQPETLAQMYTSQLEHLDQPPRRGFRFGLGFSIEDRGRYGTDYSWGGAAGTRFWSNPDQQTAILFMTQLKPIGDEFGETVRDLAYQALHQ